MEWLKQVKIWTIASRLQTWIASISPVLIGTCLASERSPISFTVFYLSLSFALLVQIGTNFVNDYFDCKNGVDTKNRIGPLRVMQANLVTADQMKKAIIFVFALSFLIGALLFVIGGIWIFSLAVLAILLGFFYTTGPFPFSYSGLADLIVLIFFGPVATLGVYYLQTHSIAIEPIYAGFSCGFFSCAILTANNLRDESQDKLADKKTLIVRFGIGFGKVEYFISILTPFFLACILQIYLPLLSLVFCIKPLKRVIKNTDIPLVLKQSAFVMLSYILLFWLHFML